MKKQSGSSESSWDSLAAEKHSDLELELLLSSNHFLLPTTWERLPHPPSVCLWLHVDECLSSYILHHPQTVNKKGASDTRVDGVELEDDQFTSVRPQEPGMVIYLFLFHLFILIFLFYLTYFIGLLYYILLLFYLLNFLYLFIYFLLHNDANKVLKKLDHNNRKTLSCRLRFYKNCLDKQFF